jgi:large conductance mechanosensitive channel
MFKEFKEFAMRGNVVDLAVGVIIGGAFGKVVSSLVSDIIMPPIGLAMGHVDFKDLAFVLKPATEGAKAVTINYGLFINTVIDFTIVAFCIFLIVRLMNKFKKPAVAASPETKTCPQCLSTIPLKATKCAFCTSPVQ